jgi:hypothetical protein
MYSLAELVEGGGGGLLAGGDDEVVAGGERERGDDVAQAAADAVAGHGVAHSLPDGVADAVDAQAVGPHAQAQEPVAGATAILQYGDEVLAAAKPLGAHRRLGRSPGPR